MAYLMVQNRQTVLLGPMDWRQRFFQSEVDDLVDQGELSSRYMVPPTEQGYVDLGDGIEIFPVAEISAPEHDVSFEALAGPFWTFTDGKAYGTHTVVGHNIDLIRANLKNLLAAERYRREVAGPTMTLQGQTVSLDTTRDGRNIFVLKYMLMNEGDTIGWKFPECWLELTKVELGSVVAAGAAHIQAQFDWERTMAEQIDAESDAAVLRTIGSSIQGGV